MDENNKKLWMPHIIYAGSLVLISLMFIATYLWTEHKNTELEMQRETFRNLCLQSAANNYRDNWTNECKHNAKIINSYLNSCVKDGLSKDYCERIFGTPDHTINCRLPSLKANNINEIYKEEKEDCFKEYPVK